MIAVEHETVIHASPAKVWTTIIRFEDYRRWHPFVRISGVPAPGAKVDYSFRVKTGDAPFRTVDARIIEFDAQRGLAFRFGLGWLFAFEETFKMFPAPTGARLVHGYRCTGLIGALPLRNLKRLFGKLLDVTDHMLLRHLVFQKPPSGNRRHARKGFRSSA
ncbi:MAG: SRPBCC family protein [Altererythrobacter sp.]|nr:SRPBCC family protein [Altererythrobacter sp.]